MYTTNTTDKKHNSYTQKTLQKLYSKPPEEPGGGGGGSGGGSCGGGTLGTSLGFLTANRLVASDL